MARMEIGARWALVSMVTAVAWTAAGTDAAAQQRTFVETLGSDTLSVESWTRSDGRLEGELVNRVPETHLVTYEATFEADGTFRTITIRTETPDSHDGASISDSEVTYRFGPDSIAVEGGPRRGAGSLPNPGGIVVPMIKLPTTYGFFDHLGRVARARGEAPEVWLLPPGAPRAMPAPFEVYPDGRVSVDDFGNPVMATVGPDGEILETDGTATTHKVRAAPGEVDGSLEFLAERYGALDARGEGIGPASTRGTARGTVGGVEIEVDYGRPAVRGRVVWGELVPYGEVWRTGADAATQLEVGSDVSLGGRRLAAGTYSLFSLPTADGLTLIVNAQTGQWGTQYDPSRDVLRVPMEAERLDAPQERLLIDIVGNELRLAWDRRRYTVSLEPAD